MSEAWPPSPAIPVWVTPHSSGATRLLLLCVDPKVPQSPGEIHRRWPTWAWWAFSSTQVQDSHKTEAQTVSSSWNFLMATHLVCVARFVVCHKLHMCFVKSLHALVLVSRFCPYFPVARGPYKILKQSSSVSPTLTRLDSCHCISHRLSVLFPGTASQTATPLLSLPGLF